MLCMLAILSHDAYAQKQKRTRILFLIDASSSMGYAWQKDDTRFAAAARIVSAVMDSMYAVNNEVEFAVRLYGSQYPSQDKNCTDTRLEVDFNLQNALQIKQKLQYVTPRGSSPIAYSLLQASENELAQNDQYDYNFVLLTDGGESCGGNICETFSNIVKRKVKISPYIIGLDSNVNLTSYYQCLGKYVAVTKPAEIATAVKMIVDDHRPLLSKPTTMGLTTQYSNSTPLEKAEPLFEGKAATVDYMPPVIRKMVASFFIPKQLKARPYQGKLFLPAYEFEAPQVDALATIFSKRTPFMSVKFSTPKLKPLTVTNKLNFPEAFLPPSDLPLVASQNVTSSAIKPLKVKYAIASANALKQGKVFVPESMIPEPDMPTVTIGELLVTKSPKIRAIKSAPAKPTAMRLFAMPFPESMKPDEIMPELTIKYIPQFINIRTRPVLTRQSKPTSITKKLKSFFPEDMIPEEPKLTIVPVFAIPFRNNMPLVPPPKFGSKFKMRAGNFPEKFLPKTASAPKPAAPVEPLKPKPKPEFKVEREQSEDTKVAVYFTDGNGKFYKTKPMCALIDPVNRQQVQNFMRDVLSNGEPEPVVTKANGKLNLLVFNKDGDVVVELPNVEIEQGKLNKIIVKVSQGTIVFQYANTLYRPVEYNALIRPRFRTQNLPDTRMKCVERKDFDAGDYYVEVDVLPKYAIMTEVSFGAVTVIALAQPGKLVFTNKEALGNVILYKEDGDQYGEFHSLIVSGQQPTELLLQPGLYKASFRPPGASKNSPPIIVNFVVKANRSTNVELRNIGNNVIDPDLTGAPVYDNSNNTAPVKINAGGSR
jgi:hypothetical protein